MNSDDGDGPKTPRVQTTARARLLSIPRPMKHASSAALRPDAEEQLTTPEFMASLVSRLGHIEQLLDANREDVRRMRLNVDTLTKQVREVNDGWHSIGRTVESLGRETHVVLANVSKAIDANTLSVGELLAEVGKMRAEQLEQGRRIASLEDRISEVEDEVREFTRKRVESIRARASKYELEDDARKAKADEVRAERRKYWMRWAAAGLLTLAATSGGVGALVKACSSAPAKTEQHP